MKIFSDAMHSIRRSSIFLALVLIAVGIMFFFFPASSTLLICYITGLALCIWGIIRIFAYFNMDTNFVFSSFGFVQGIALLIAGASILINPSFLASFLITAFGIILIIDSALKLQHSIDLMKIKTGGWLAVLIVAIAAALLGAVMIINPFGTARTLLRFAGIALIADGIADLITTLHISRSIKRAKEFFDSAHGSSASSNPHIIQVDAEEIPHKGFNGDTEDR